MDLKIQIQGLGKIEKLSLDIKPLTVIAGENSSGKTFATKSIYCVLQALNQDQLLGAFHQQTEYFLDSIRRFEISLTPKAAKTDQDFIDQINFGFVETAKKIHKCLSDLTVLEHFKLESLINEEKKYLLLLIEQIDSHLKKRNKVEKFKKSAEYLIRAQKFLRNLCNILNDSESAVSNYIAESLSDNFKRNYQVIKLSELINTNKSAKGSINIDEIGSLNFSNKGEIFFEFAKQGIHEIQKLNEVVFIDSPIYLRIRKGLQKSTFGYPRNRTQTRELEGYPEHIDNLYAYVDRKHMDEPEEEFLQLSAELQKTLEGRLVVNKAGEVHFHDSEGNPTPLSLAATGVSNLGLIDLLIRNNVIKKGSFLIIDEPEAHIHPKWQVLLMDVLYKMATAGVNVIIATHSLDMLKKLQLIVKQETKADELVSVHRMPESNLKPGAALLDKIEESLTDLSTPYYQMYLEDNN